jgi:hypothetical protein
VSPEDAPPVIHDVVALFVKVHVFKLRRVILDFEIKFWGRLGVDVDDEEVLGLPHDVHPVFEVVEILVNGERVHYCGRPDGDVGGQEPRVAPLCDGWACYFQGRSFWWPYGLDGESTEGVEATVGSPNFHGFL